MYFKALEEKGGGSGITERSTIKVSHETSLVYSDPLLLQVLAHPSGVFGCH